MSQTENKPYVVVVGGMNVDIGGQSNEAIVMEDSNPGKVTVSLGGVGRNIAHNLSLMGIDVRLLSARGNDANGQLAEASCVEAGIDYSNIFVAEDGRTSTYLYLSDSQGNMVLAVSDMDICEKISPAYLQQKLSLLNQAAAVVFDTNIPEASIQFLAENCTAPLFCDPVSTIKAKKITSVLDKIYTLKPNRLEAELLSGVQIQSPEDAFQAGKALVAKGLQRVFISIGAKGVCAITKDEQLHMNVIPGNVQNTTGCGDAFMAGLVWAYVQNFNFADSTKAGLAAASIAMESKETINSNLSSTLMQERML